MKPENRRRWGAILALGTLLFLSLISASRLHLDERLTSMLPDTDPIFNRYLFVAQRFHVLDAVYVDIESESARPGDQHYAREHAKPCGKPGEMTREYRGRVCSDTKEGRMPKGYLTCISDE